MRVRGHPAPAAGVAGAHRRDRDAAGSAHAGTARRCARRSAHGRLPISPRRRRRSRDGLPPSGVRPGDRVLVVGENCAALVALLFGIARVDAWPVLVNARLSAREIDAIRDHCSPRRTVYLAHVSAEAAAHAARHGAPSRSSSGHDGRSAAGSRKTGECLPEPVVADPATRVGALIYTTGTTGDPKGVMLTHRNLLFIAKVSSALRKLGPGDRVYGVLPISHVYGLASVCLGTLYRRRMPATRGALLSPRHSPTRCAHCGLTVAQGVPAMYARLLEAPRDVRRTLRGAAAALRLRRRLAARPGAQGRRRATDRADAAQRLRPHGDRAHSHPDAPRRAAPGLLRGHRDAWRGDPRRRRSRPRRRDGRTGRVMGARAQRDARLLPESNS